MANPFEGLVTPFRSKASPSTLIKETAASRAVEGAPFKFVDAGLSAETAQGLTKALKEYLISYPKAGDQTLRELSRLGLSEESAKSVLLAVDKEMKAS